MHNQTKPQTIYVHTHKQKRKPLVNRFLFGKYVRGYIAIRLVKIGIRGEGRDNPFRKNGAGVGLILIHSDRQTYNESSCHVFHVV